MVRECAIIAESAFIGILGGDFFGGLDGRGGSSYIDAVVLRQKDDNSGWANAADGVLIGLAGVDADGIVDGEYELEGS